MANANAIVEKLKDVGLRHGEKAGVAVASAVVLPLHRPGREEGDDRHRLPTRSRRPTKASESNLGRHEDRGEDHPEPRRKGHQGQ